MMVLLMIEKALQDLGCNFIHSAATVDHALRLLDTEVFDAATLELNLSGNSSLAVADALEAKGVPFAFSTGCSDRDGTHTRHPHPVLRKPYSFSQFEQMFKTLLPASAG